MANAKNNHFNSWFWDFLLFALLFSLLGYYTFYCLNIPNVLLEQGISHRIFYFHVPVAWVALYGPIFSSIASIFYLIFRKNFLDQYSYSLNIISLIFSFGVLFSGPIWAQSAWGVPWDWTDARLQSFFILFLSLIGYFIFRNLVISNKKKMILGAYLTILCALNSVLTWGAIRWFDNPGNHPSSILGKGGMDFDMKIGFYGSVIAYHFLFLVLLRIIIRYVQIQDNFFRLKEKIEC
jgi:heme exporter protein C